jgi:hypothetical protein
LKGGIVVAMQFPIVGHQISLFERRGIMFTHNIIAITEYFNTLIFNRSFTIVPQSSKGSTKTSLGLRFTNFERARFRNSGVDEILSRIDHP